MGEAAFLLEAGTQMDLDVQARVWNLAEVLASWPLVLETVPGVNNLLVLFDAFAPDSMHLEQALRQAWDTAPGAVPAGRLVEIPVAYGGAFGMDLADLAAHAGLSPEQYVERHSAGEYSVLAIGAVPGFPYLAGLAPALGKPRRSEPRLRVEAGAVIVGGMQAGILPVSSPSGWHVLGRTQLTLFDPFASPPTLLAPGDRIRFLVESFTP
ncbi:5-oxoprolinase subunit PxpB [Xanthobacter versatilis]|uniref:5-oxoprolinase subunit PxpB n=1 Tax=Xanthobacter autotrophicus (strain ATCC BAA-1158 / Py2) TaxID=78245 RepID=UPI00372CA92F